MSELLGRLLDIQGVGDPTSVAQDNFEVLSEEVFQITPTYQNGVTTTIIGPPTSGARVLNELWKDVWNAHWRCTVAGTPGTWRQEKPAITVGEPNSGTIPVGYQIEDSTDNYRRKWHVGGYVWEPVSFAYGFQRVTGFTGGGSTNLDGVATTSLAAGTIAEFTVSSSRYLYRLRAGTEAELSPFIIRPDDYNASTNAKVWERMFRSEFPADVSRDLTGLTGSTAADLNAIPTNNLTVGSIVWFLLSGSLVCYRLRSGTDATNSPTVIRPVDFQSSLNPKVWERMVIVATPGDIMIGNNNLSEIASTAAKRSAARTNLDVLWADDARGLFMVRTPRAGLTTVADTSFKVTGVSGVNFGTSDFTISLEFRFGLYPPSSTMFLFASHASGNNRVIFNYRAENQFELRFVDGSGGLIQVFLTPDVTLVSGESYHTTITVSRSGNATLYINGISDRDKSGTGVSASCSSASGVDIGSGNSNPWSGFSAPSGQVDIYHGLKAFNRCISATEVLTLAKLSRAEFADQWGSFTNLIDSSTNNGSFETAGAGGADVFASWVEGVAGTSTITDDTAEFHSGGHSCKFTIDSSNSAVSLSSSSSLLTIGKRYRMQFWAKVDSLSGSPSIKTNADNGASAVTLTSTSWTQYTMEFVSVFNSASIARNSGCANRTIWIDDITLVPIGAILDLDLENAAPTQSLTIRDRSTNNNHGTAAASGVSQINRVRQGNFIDGLTVGSSTILKKHISTTATLDFGSIAAASSADLTITVTGAATGDAVAIGLPSSPAAGIVFFGFVSATNTVTIRAMNITGSAVDPASATYRATIFQY